MLFRPDAEDYRVIGNYTGKVVYGLALAMVVPLIVAIVNDERNEAYAFVIGIALASITGAASQLLRRRVPLDASRGLVVVGLAWIVAPIFAAVPLLLSGHYASYMDAYFEAVSGLTTTGLSLVNDVDHMAHSMNLWRHLLHFLGGQGIIIVVLTIFASAGAALGTLYTGEGRSERVLPNITHTARFITRVVAVYGVLGISGLWLALTLHVGLDPLPAVNHALSLFLASFYTAGFSLQSTSVAFYHSAVIEAILAVLMIAGTFSFVLHYQLWQNRRGELRRNLEGRTMAFTLLAIFGVLVIGLGRTATMTSFEGLFRVGFFQTLSAHTTTGLSTVPDRLFVTDWGALAPAMLVIAMALGGMAGSTSGGIKAIRVGLLLKGLRRDIRQVLLPENAVVVESYHSTTSRILRSEQVRGAATILLLFVLLYLAGGMLGLFYGYDLTLALFESTSAAATAGFSVDVIRPDLEVPLKVVYIAQMLLGRLEFVAVFAVLGYLVAIVRGRA